MNLSRERLLAESASLSFWSEILEKVANASPLDQIHHTCCQLWWF